MFRLQRDELRKEAVAVDLVDAAVAVTKRHKVRASCHGGFGQLHALASHTRPLQHPSRWTLLRLLHSSCCSYC
jgi:hypothetical protein